MMIERVYEVIRKEEAVLWIGAGFSRYAGYPMAKELSKILHENLTKQEQKEVNSTDSFDKIAQTYVDQRRTKNSLIDLLTINYANRVPKSTEYHDKLAKIPHLKTIITTNFDTLLENAYNNMADIIVDDSDVTKINENRTAIIKVHGDFKHTNKLVITSEDYSDFIATGLNSSIWSVVLERVLTKHIIFVGYGVEDPNVIAMINKISNILGDNRKEIYFISPSISSAKKSNLESKRIIPVLMKGEEFIDGLSQSIENNILTDLKKQYVSSATCQEFMRRRDLYAKFCTSANTTDIIDFTSPIREVAHIGKFTIIDEEISKLILNKTSTEEIVIPAEKLGSFDFKIDGLRHPISDLSNLKNITLIPIPKDTLTDFLFVNASLNVRSIKTKIYTANKNVRLVFVFEAGECEFKIILNEKKNVNDDKRFKIQIQIKLYQTQKLTNSAIQFLSFLTSILKSNDFTLRTHNGIKLPLKIPSVKSINVSEYEEKLEYFKQLKKIEDYYIILFTNIDKINKSDIHNTNLISKGISGSIIDNTVDNDLKFDFNDNCETKMSINFEEEKLHAITNEEGRARIHNYEFLLGGRVIEVVNPIYENKSEFDSGKSSSLIIHCKAGNYFYNYENLLKGKKLFKKDEG